MKKLIILLMLLSTIGFSQTASIPELQAMPKETVIIPVNVANWVEIGALSIYIDFDPTVLKFCGSELSQPDMMIGNQGGHIILIWTATPSVSGGGIVWNTWTFDGTIAQLYFEVYGSSTLDFTSQCEVVQLIPPNTLNYLPVQYTNGSIYIPMRGCTRLK